MAIDNDQIKARFNGVIDYGQHDHSYRQNVYPFVSPGTETVTTEEEYDKDGKLVKRVVRTVRTTPSRQSAPYVTPYWSVTASNTTSPEVK